MAITRYLCREYGMGTLCPQDPQQAALADQWMDWYKAILTPSLMPVFFNLVRTAGSAQDLAVIERGTAATIQCLGVLEQHLQAQAYIPGESFSMGDIPLGAMICKFFNLDIERPALPAIEAWYARLCQHPAYR